MLGKNQAASHAVHGSGGVMAWAHFEALSVTELTTSFLYIKTISLKVKALPNLGHSVGQ